MTTPDSGSQKQELNSSKGSDRKQSEPDFLVIGQIIKPHGITGEVSVKVLTDFPERFEAMEAVFVGDDSSADLYPITSTRWHRQHILITFPNVSGRDAADRLRGLYLKVPREEAIPLEPDAYYNFQLVGLTVITDEGKTLGQLTQVLETGANDVYVIQGDQRELLLPAIEDVILSVDLGANQMIVHLLAGLVE